MNVLENILKQIDELKENYWCDSKERKDGAMDMSNIIKDIIKQHLQYGEDVNKENDWIPIKNGFPKNDGVYDFTVITGIGEPVVVRWQFLSGKHLSGKQIYVDEKHYIANNYNGDPINEYLIKNITAWRPLPEPYKPDPESADAKRQRERE